MRRLLTLLLLIAVAGLVSPAPAAASAAPEACPVLPAVVAHRGGTEAAMENTLGAFRAAGAVGITRWELDVRFDVHGLPVVLHDATVDRVSPASGRIAELDASDGAIRTDDGQYVPTLREVYAEAVTYRAVVFTELKVMPTAEQWRSLAAEIDRSVGRDAVLLMAFGRDIVLAARQQVPGAETALVHEAGYLNAEQITPYGDTFVKSYRVISERRATEWHAAGLAVYAWTVNADADWQRLAGWPIDGIITDRPIAYDAWATGRCLSPAF